MTVLNFPASPSTGDTYTENNIIYTWNGSYWEANNTTSLNDLYVEVKGDNMEGDLTLGTDKVRLRTNGEIYCERFTSGDLTDANYINNMQRSGGGNNFELAGKVLKLITGGIGDPSVSTKLAFEASGISDDAYIALGGNYIEPAFCINKTVRIGGILPYAPNITLSATGDVQSTSQNSGPLAGFRNQLINSNFNVNQRAATSITVPANNTDYFVDRWKIQPSVRNPGVGTTVSIGGEISPSLPWSWNLAIDGNSVVFQQIELERAGRQTVFTIGSTWTLSVYANIDITSYSPSLVFSAPVEANKVTAAAATPFILIESAVGGSAYNRYAATFTITGDVNTSGNVNSIDSLIVPIANGAVTGAGNIALPQFEPGPVATPVETRPAALELTLCQRYFVNIGTVDQMANYRPPERGIQMPYPTTMRTTPSYSYTKYYQYIGTSWAEYTGAGIGVTRNTHGFVFTQDNSNSSVPIIATEVTADAEL